MALRFDLSWKDIVKVVNKIKSQPLSVFLYNILSGKSRLCNCISIFFYTKIHFLLMGKLFTLMFTEARLLRVIDKGSKDDSVILGGSQR